MEQIVGVLKQAEGVPVAYLFRTLAPVMQALCRGKKQYVGLESE